MNSLASQEPTERLVHALGHLRKKGVRLWSENGQLRYAAPRGALTQEDLTCLRGSRDQIIALLERAAGEALPRRRRETDPVPLTFSQLSHWYWYHLGERRNLRQIASATRLCGHLDIDALRASLAEVVRRHEALRTRIVVRDWEPVQEVSEPGEPALEIDDLSGVPEDLRESEVRSRIEQYILEPIDVSVGPLFGVRLLRLSDREHVLVTAMEHIISDGCSRSILLREIFTAYVQAVQGRPFSLPATGIQFADYALWQKNTHPAWLEKHALYWSERLAGCKRVRFPVDPSVPGGTRRGWGTVPVRIDSNIKAELREWCRVRRTTLVMSVFAVYTALVLRWCNASDIVMQYVTDGRVAADVQNTIGAFAFYLSVRIELGRDDTLADLVQQATREYCSAYEHADFAYIESQLPRPEFVRNSAFNWQAQGSSGIHFAELDGSEHALACSAALFEHPLPKIFDRDVEPGVMLFDTDEEIVGAVHFPMNRFSSATMEQFARNFTAFIATLVRKPEERITSLTLT